MKDRLALFLETQELKAGKFAQIMGIQPSNVTHIISGRSKPGFEFIANMLTNFPELNPDWLILGAGDMFRYEKEQPKITEDNPIEEGLFAHTEHTETAEEESNQPESQNEDTRPHITDSQSNANTTTSAENDEIEAIILFHNDGTFSKYSQR